MITKDILCRTFRIHFRNHNGTAFTIEKDDIQYIITAKHIFDSVKHGDIICVGVLIEKKYCPITVEIKFSRNESVDCAVLLTKPYHEISERYSNENTIEGLSIGQDVYFLGFPYNYDNLLLGFPDSTTPVPFVKKACLSGLSQDIGQLFLDGINNPGFSGGPVCFKDSKTEKYKIAGLINSYRFFKNPVYAADESATDFYVQENTGIIYACSIMEALSIIDSK